MSSLDPRVEPGWDVLDDAGEKLGSVVQVGPDFLYVEKGLLLFTDLYIPASAVASIDRARQRVVLNVSKDAVGQMGWTEPPAGRGRETWGQGTLDDDRSGDASA